MVKNNSINSSTLENPIEVIKKDYKSKPANSNPNNEDNEPGSVIEKITRFLSSHYIFYRDKAFYTYKAEYQTHNGERMPFDETAEAGLCLEAAEKLKTSPETVSTALKYYLKAKSIEFDSIMEYFKSLPKWDGVPRADMYFVDFLGAPDTIYVHEVTRLILDGIYRRALLPGCTFDYMLILQGTQGIGKSTALRQLVPPCMFTDSMTFYDMVNNKNAIEKLDGVLLAEMPELVGFKGKTIASIKSFITAKDDVCRLAYARNATRQPRRAVFVASTNDDDFFEDVTGNRRFLPLECEKKSTIIDTLSDDYIPQLWAEIKEEHDINKPLTLSPNSAKYQQEMLQALHIYNNQQDRYIQAIDNLKLQGHPLTNANIWDELNPMPGRAPSNTELAQVGKTMKFLGFEQIREKDGNRRRRVWVDNGCAAKYKEKELLEELNEAF